MQLIPWGFENNINTKQTLKTVHIKFIQYDIILTATTDGRPITIAQHLKFIGLFSLIQ